VRGVRICLTSTSPNSLQTCTKRFRGIDFVQEKVFGKEPQDDGGAVEQAKDEQISDFLREQHSSAT
jgi:hypothetical protein